MRKRIGIASIALAGMYFASYCIVRINREVGLQNGAYRIESMNNALFSDGVVFVFYRPLILADQLTMDSSEVDIKPE